MPTVQPSPSPVLTPTANRVGCEREVATSVLAANHNRGWSVPGTREQSEIPRATGVEYGARSCQGSMYQAESLIAPKALLAKLLLWNVTLPRYPMVRRKPRFLPLYLLSRPFEHPRISFPLWLYVIDFLLSFSLSFSLSLFLFLSLSLSLFRFQNADRGDEKKKKKKEEKTRGHVRNSKWTGSQRWERRKEPRSTIRRIRKWRSVLRDTLDDCFGRAPISPALWATGRICGIPCTFASKAAAIPPLVTEPLAFHDCSSYFSKLPLAVRPLLAASAFSLSLPCVSRAIPTWILADSTKLICKLFLSKFLSFL